MEALNERIAKELEHLEQLERWTKLKENRNKNKMEKLNTRRLIITGKIVSQHFPEVLRFQPRRTEADNAVEFAPLLNFVKLLAADEDYTTQLREKAISLADQQEEWYVVYTGD